MSEKVQSWMDSGDVAFWRSFFDEVHQCVVPERPQIEDSGAEKKRQPYKRRQIDLSKPPVISWKEKVSDMISDEEDEVYEPDSSSEVSSSEEEDEEWMQDEVDRYEVSVVQQRQVREDGIDYLVEFANPYDGELPEWVSINLLTSHSAQNAIRIYDEQQQEARRQAYKTTGEVLQKRTRSQNKRK